MTTTNRGVAEVVFTKTGPSGRPLVEISTPAGTRLVDLLKSLEYVATEILPKLSPVGCAPCTSGVDLHIREQFEEIVRVDIAAGRPI
jgi:hypothetical protein